MWQKLTHEYIKTTIEKENYKLLSGVYINAHTNLKCECSYGHIYNVTWCNWKAGNRCPYCSSAARLTIDFIKSEFEKEGYNLLTTEYINNNQKLDYICPSDHKHAIAWKNWKNGVRCPFCDSRRTNYEVIKSSFEQEGYKLISSQYINCKHKLKYICSNGHTNYMSWDNWKNSGHRCSICAIINKSGPNHPNWKGGISCEPYCIDWGKDLKEYIKDRDGHTCQNPDCWGTSNRLSVHHIDYNKKNCGPDNLITLCNSCNSRANIDRDWHKTFYKNIIKIDKDIMDHETR